MHHGPIGAVDAVHVAGVQVREMQLAEAVRDDDLARVEVARINADFGEDNAADAAVPVRVSDHDPMVLYFDLR